MKALSPRILSLACLGCVLVALPAMSRDSGSVFTSANEDFEQGELKQAEMKYMTLVENGLVSSDLYFNLGTTQYRLENPGEAMLWFRRAQIVEPNAPEIPQNIEFLKNKIGFLEFGETGLGSVLRALPSGLGKWVGSALLWLAAIAIAAPFCLPSMRDRLSGYLVLGVVLGMFGYVCLRLDHFEKTQIAPQNFATVITSGAKALTAPSPASKAVIDLPPGSEVRIIQTTGQWRYVDIPGELRGWVRAEQIEPVWPILNTAS
ncbi:MAG: hypothetical protein AAGF67_04195 [Verrucomicrobiota bacterium]